MKTIGLLGGMSWESTALYYRLINEQTRRVRGGLHSAPIVMASVDFSDIEKLQRAGDWDAAGRVLAEHAARIETAGADLLLICTNTMHKVAGTIAGRISIPLLHIADATASHILDQGLGTVGLLGTRFTMEHDFYKGRLSGQGLDVIVPDEADRELVHRVIYDELCLGRIDGQSRREYVRIVAGLQARGAEAVIAGCTEIGLLVQQEHLDIPLFDTTAIHAHRAVAVALT